MKKKNEKKPVHHDVRGKKDPSDSHLQPVVPSTDKRRGSRQTAASGLAALPTTKASSKTNKSGATRKGRRVEKEPAEDEPVEKEREYPRRRTYGERAIYEGQDREPAIWGLVDPSKLVITMNTVRDDPRKKGRTIPGMGVQYSYLEKHPEPDWNSISDIRKINTWRRDLFKVNFGPRPPDGDPWLKSEVKVAFDLMRQQLKTQERLDWPRLVKDYNQKLAGTVQNIGEELHRPKSGFSSKLTKAREAPLRVHASIKTAMKSSPEYRALRVKAAAGEIQSDGEENDNGNAQDLELDHDESPMFPEIVQPTKRTTKKTAKASADQVGKEKVAEKRHANDSDSDEDFAESAAKVPARKRAKKNIGRMSYCDESDDEAPLFPGLVELMKKKL